MDKVIVKLTAFFDAPFGLVSLKDQPVRC